MQPREFSIIPAPTPDLHSSIKDNPTVASPVKNGRSDDLSTSKNPAKQFPSECQHTEDVDPPCNSPQANPRNVRIVQYIRSRLTTLVGKDAGSLWGSIETAAAGEAHPIWFEIRPQTDVNGNINGAIELQEDCFFCGGFVNNGSAYFSTLQPYPENNATMVYNYSEDDEYPGTAYTARKVDYCCLMNGSGFFIRGGDAFYGEGRRGDYSGTAVDNTLANSPSVWFSGMYAESDGDWGTWIGGNQPAVP